jgi:hypothetical protein
MADTVDKVDLPIGVMSFGCFLATRLLGDVDANPLGNG